MTNSDGQLVADVLAGARDRFAEIVQRYELALLRAANSRLGRWDRAEDAVQETFYCAFKSLHTYDSAYSFRTWLWTILLNQCRRQYQKLKKRDHETHPDPAIVSEELPWKESPSVLAMTKERDAQLHQWLCSLPESQADALRLRFFGGLKFREIADAMQCSLTTAKIRVRKGLEQLSVWIREASGNEDASQIFHPEARS